MPNMVIGEMFMTSGLTRCHMLPSPVPCPKNMPMLFSVPGENNGLAFAIPIDIDIKNIKIFLFMYRIICKI